MQNGEIIPALIARIRQNNTDNVIIRSKLYNLLNNVTSKFNDVTKATPHIVAIYKNKRLVNQFGSNLKEAAYHRKVRIRAIKRGGTIVEGTILETKSKYPINTFENESSKEVSK